MWLIKHPIQWVPNRCGSPSLSNGYRSWLTNIIQCIKPGFDTPSIPCSGYQPVVAQQVSYPMWTNRLWLIKYPIQWVPVVAHKLSYPMKNRFWLTNYPIQWVPNSCGSPSILSKGHFVAASQVSHSNWVPTSCGSPSILSNVKNQLWLTKYSIQWVPNRCGSLFTLQWVPTAFCPDVKRPNSESVRSPLTRIQVRNACRQKLPIPSHTP